MLGRSHCRRIVRSRLEHCHLPRLENGDQKLAVSGEKWQLSLRQWMQCAFSPIWKGCQVTQMSKVR